jgi:hypothetical protein
MDGVTKFLVYLRVLLCPPPLFSRQETRKKSACGTHNLSIRSIFVCFNCPIPLARTEMSGLCPELWVHGVSLHQWRSLVFKAKAEARRA